MQIITTFLLVLMQADILNSSTVILYLSKFLVYI